jgi:anti-sigma regulatory factor (Ser/Thr protein kinase)
MLLSPRIEVTHALRRYRRARLWAHRPRRRWRAAEHRAPPQTAVRSRPLDRVALRKLERPIANLSRFVISEVALLRQPNGVGLPPKAVRSWSPASGSRDLVKEGLVGRALGLMRAASGPLLRPVLEITGIATVLASGQVRRDPPGGLGLIGPIDLELDREPGAPRRARAEIRHATRGRMPEAESATATLLTSELVTNAAIHPKQRHNATIGLRITSYQDRLRVEVTDAGAGFVAPNAPVRRPEIGGNGLLFVDRLASRWGTTRPGHRPWQGFCVWFELDTTSQDCCQSPATEEPGA